MHYIYIDTKIEGTIYQLVEYFRSGVFNSKNYCVYYKKYKKGTKNFSKIFQKEGIEAIGFKKYSELSFKDNSIVFYLFNAQSNCRIVANRQLTHIFVTHGESNKISSVKPIIRIYDHVITSGKIGVQRYLDNGIFFPEDVKRNRIIMMGDTFIGDNQYHFDSDSKTILYAPTWEGGIPEENYSSLEWDNIFEKLLLYIRENNITTVVVQLHPNLGHRDSRYINKAFSLLNKLIQNNIKTIIIKTKVLGFLLLILKLKGLKVVDDNFKIDISEGFCDVSAIETQLYNKNIPCGVFIKEKTRFIGGNLKKHYALIGIKKDQDIANKIFYDNSYKQNLLQYTNGIEITKNKLLRIDILINFILRNKL